MSDQAKGLAALLAAYGRNGDTELVHVNKHELQALEKLGQRHGIHTTTNPQTGLKEAFNWLGTAGGILGGIAGSFIAPGAGTAAGAALGSGIGTKVGGGTTQQALTNGLISGVTAYAGAGLADSLASAGTDAATQATTDTLTKAGTDATLQTAGGAAPGGTSVANAFANPNAITPGSGLSPGLSNVANTGGNAFGAASPQSAASSFVNPTAGPGGSVIPSSIAPPPVSPAPTTEFAPFGGDAAQLPAGGFKNAVPQDASSQVLQSASQPKVSAPDASFSAPKNSIFNDQYRESMGKGWDKINAQEGGLGKWASDNSGKLITTGTGLYGIATQAPPGSTSSTEPTTTSYTLPKTEVYYTANGERRTRVVDRPQYGNVNMANGGEIYGDYDGVDMNRTGGTVVGGATFANGGVARFNGGGIGMVRQMQPGGQWGDMTSAMYGAVQEQKPQWLQNLEPGGFIGATVPGKMDWEDKKKEEEERKKREEEAGIAAAAKAKEKAAFEQQWSDRYGAPVQLAAAGGMMGYATGGISDLGGYSDGGRMLRGPGDGVSDSIPASIEGKRPARLADGEFVVPARAVSELGNGSTEAGSKQLYAMLDRIAKKRKKGNGLAYQANPKKLMPV